MNHDEHGIRILLVDDNRRLLAALNQRFSAMGFCCTCCDNASEAIMQFAARDIDLVVTDLHMRGIDGYSLIEMIRNQSNIPIIVTTGYSEELGAWHLIHNDVETIRKPLDMAALPERIRAILLQRQAVVSK